MIWDSRPWKQDLARRAESIERRRTQRKWFETSFAALERDVFLAAYSVRKLLDAFKVSYEIESSTVNVSRHAALGRAVDYMNWDKLPELYDLSQESSEQVDTRGACNLLIHSFVFVPYLTEKGSGLAGFYVASDRDRDRWLTRIDVDELLAMLHRVADDDIVYAVSKRRTDSGPLEIIKKSNRHPDEDEEVTRP